MSRPNIQRNNKDLFELSLTQWLEQSPQDEIENREDAIRRIRECKEENSEYLSLAELRLTSLPEAIGNLTSLKSLDLSENQLQTLPETIIRLTSLQNLDLSYNQLQTFPEAIVNLTSLQNLDLEGNLITEQELQRLNRILEERLAIDCYSGIFFQNEKIVKSSILDLYQSVEERQSTEVFLSNDKFADFNNFLSECSRTAGWNSSRVQMKESLHNLINKMKEDERLAAKCAALSRTSSGSCGDRVSLAYVQMILAANTSQKPVIEMSTQELFEYAKQESVTKFLTDKAETRINRIRTRGGVLDEIETYLAYLQAAPRLEVNLPASVMIYQFCSNATEADLENAVIEFTQRNPTFRAAEHAYKDDSLRTHPLIKRIINAKNSGDGLDLYAQENESSQDYMLRMNRTRENIANSIIDEIEREFQLSPALIEQEQSINHEFLDLTETPAEEVRTVGHEVDQNRVSETIPSRSVAPSTVNQLLNIFIANYLAQKVRVRFI